MKPEQEPKPTIDNPDMPHAYITFGAPGHETEYVFTLQPSKYSEAQDLPDEWEDLLVDSLGDEWSIMNRGGYRIEIRPPNSERASESDAKIREAVENIIGRDHKLELKGKSH